MSNYYLEDLAKQALAELSLQNADDQFPIDTKEFTFGDTGLTIREYVNKRLSDLTTEGAIPIQTFSPQYLNPALRTMTTPSGLVKEDVVVGTTNSIIDISKQISSGTAQGTVYKVDVHPNASLHYIRTSDADEDIPAILKKSPIYDPTLWRIANTLEVALEAKSMGVDPTPLLAPLAPELGRSWWSFISTAPPESLKSELERIQQELTQQWNNINNDAYIDAVGYYLGGSLTSMQISPFFGLLYGTSRVDDNAYFPTSDPFVQVLGDRVNEGFPVQLTFLQPLNATMYDVVDKEDWFHGPDGKLNVDHALSMFDQVTKGLAVAQSAFGLVHDDFHGGNLMEEDVPYDTYIYTRRMDTGKVYRTPTYGKVWKMIDFGRAVFGDEGFGSVTEALAYPYGWNLTGKGNDLYRFTSVFVATLGLEEWLASDPSALEGNELLLWTMLNSILQCGPSGGNVFTKQAECQVPGATVQSVLGYQGQQPVDLDCQDFAFNVWPYLKGSPCQESSIPANNLHWFDIYEVDPSTVPDGATIFPVF